MLVTWKSVPGAVRYKVRWGNGEVIGERQCWTVGWPEKEHAYHAKSSAELFECANNLFLGVRFW